MLSEKVRELGYLFKNKDLLNSGFNTDNLCFKTIISNLSKWLDLNETWLLKSVKLWHLQEHHGFQELRKDQQDQIHPRRKHTIKL